MTSIPPLRISGLSLRCWTAAVLLLVFTETTCLRGATSEATPKLEYQVKAGWIFNFLRFTEWPPQKLEAGATIRLGVVSDTSVAKVISDALAGKRVNDHLIEVVVLGPSDPIDTCHLVFVPANAPEPRRDPVPGVLMVGERPNYASDGGMIGFVVRDYGPRLQINLEAAQRAGLKLSSHLAGVADLVRSNKP